jgi:hypothetical protein
MSSSWSRARRTATAAGSAVIASAAGPQTNPVTACRQGASRIRAPPGFAAPPPPLLPPLPLLLLLLLLQLGLAAAVLFCLPAWPGLRTLPSLAMLLCRGCAQHCTAATSAAVTVTAAASRASSLDPEPSAAASPGLPRGSAVPRRLPAPPLPPLLSSAPSPAPPPTPPPTFLLC